MFVAADITGCVSPDYSVFNASPLANVKFYQYLFRSPCSVQQFANASRGVGAGFNRLYTPQFGAIETLLPSPDEQRQIVAYLDEKTAKVDRLIQLKEREIELLNEKKQAMISKVVTGKFAVVGSNTEVQRHRDGRATSMKSPPAGLRPRRSDELVDSGVDWIGQVPKGWKVMRLRHTAVGKFDYGANASGIPYDAGLPRYIRITDIDSNGCLKDDDQLSLPSEEAVSYFLEDGDILFARSGGTVGKSFIFRAKYGCCCYAGYLIRYRPNPSIVDSNFAYAYTNSGLYKQWLSKIFIQATIQNVSAERYKNLWIPVPPLPEQREIVAYLDGATAKIDAAVAAIEKSIGLLKERRTRLVSDAVTGRIDLRKEVA